MNFQTIAVIIIFIAALFYIGRLIYKAVFVKTTGCSTGCGKCGVDFSNVETTEK